jgi:hypothetical protein
MNMSIQGNDGLCGGIPELHLAPCSIFASKNKKRHLSKSLMITLTSISVLVSSVSVVILIQLVHKKLRKRHETQLISMHCQMEPMGFLRPIWLDKEAMAWFINVLHMRALQ